jgi:hypothetical protein
LFFSFIGSIGDYPRQRAYSDPFTRGNTSSAGSNDSDKDAYLETSGVDNWWEMKLEFVLPIGAMKDEGMANYKLKRGILV